MLEALQKLLNCHIKSGKNAMNFVGVRLWKEFLIIGLYIINFVVLFIDFLLKFHVVLNKFEKPITFCANLCNRQNYLTKI